MVRFCEKKGLESVLVVAEKGTEICTVRVLVGHLRDGSGPPSLQELHRVEFWEESLSFRGPTGRTGVLRDSHGRITYIGELLANKPHGFGRSFYPSGCLHYKGEWKTGKYDGRGAVYENVSPPSAAKEKMWKAGVAVPDVR